MITTIRNITRLLLLVFMALLFSGCTSMQTLSSYARTGDTISVAIGGTDESNALVEILKKEDISLTITDAAGNSYPVKLRRLFRVYPDHTSEYMYDAGRSWNSNISAHAPVMIGQWMAIVDLVDPLTNVAPALSEGMASIAISSIEQLKDRVQYSPYNLDNGNLASVGIEILAGQGTSNTLNYLDIFGYDPLATIEPLPQILVSPSALPVSNIAGGSFTFIYNAADFATQIKVVPANHDPNVQIMSTRKNLSDGTTELKVIILNPDGFLSSISREEALGKINIGGLSPFRSVKFNLFWKPIDYVGDAYVTSTVTDLNWKNSIQLVSGQYIDLEGNVVNDIFPVMSKVR